MENYKSRISVNGHYDPTKGKEHNNNRVANGWSLKEYSWTEPSVRELTTQHGISCNEYSGEHRSTDSWIGTMAIMLDFDDGSVSSSQLLDDQKSWKFDSYIYSSQNHQKPKEKQDGTVVPKCDRLRGFIPLDVPITNLKDLKAVEAYFKQKYPTIDQSFTGQARYFAHGTTEVSSFRNSQGPLKWREITDLDKYMQAVSVKSWQEKTETLIQLSDKVLNAKAQEYQIKDIVPGEPIYCPFCGLSDKRTGDGHNAVIKINDDDLPFLFCSSCQSRDLGNKGVYNFEEVDGYIYRLTLDDKLVFIDTLKANFMGGCNENGLQDYVVRDLGGTQRALQFCKYHGVPYPTIYPRARYELVFDSDERAEFDKGYVNKYSVTDLLKAPVPDGHVAKKPKYIGLLIDHIMTDDQDIIDRFYNDISWFVQNRKKLITSYLWQGVEGTGKGLFFTKVLQVIFGMQYCAQADQDAFGTQFNSFLADNVLVLVNEVSGNFSGTEAKGIATIEKMKIAITDEHIQIEGKNKDRFNGKNVCSFLFATNRRDAITLSDNDRRFNVAPRQEVKLHNTSWWPGYEQLLALIESELQEVVWYLKQYQVDESLIGKVIDNEPKRVLQIMSQTNADMFFEAVNRGDLTWLEDNIVKEVSGYDHQLRNQHFENILYRLKGATKVAVNDLCELYNNINGKRLTPNAFGRLAAGHLGESKSVKIDGKTHQGFKINWNSRDLTLEK
jgi:hypothetical protein